MAQPPRDSLARRSDVTSVLWVSAHLGFVLFPLFAAAYAGPSWWWVLAWGFIGFAMNGILNLMHECAHGLTFRSKRHSEFLGGAIIAPLVLADFEGYKTRHWQHHRHLGGPGETKDAYLVEIRGIGLLRLLTRCLAGVEALRKFAGQARHSRARRQGSKVRWLANVAIVHALVVLVLFAVATAGQESLRAAVVSTLAAYGSIYIYGLMSLTVFAATLRAIAEHQIHGDSDVQGYAALRNFRCNAITRFLMGAYGFGEHETHHLYPGIPYYRLPAATAVLAESRPSLKPGPGYFATLLRIVRTDQSAGSTVASAQIS